MAEVGRFLPQHLEEIAALFSIYPDRVVTALSYANGTSESEGNVPSKEVGNLAAASSSAGYAVLKVSIPLNFADSHSDRDCVVVEAWLDGELEDAPIQSDSDRAASAGEPIAVASGCRPTFERTESGRRLYCQFSMMELPPLELVVILLPGYPEFKPPDFVIFSPCLNNVQKTVVCKKLDELAAENEGLPVILTWSDWLQNDCLKMLGVTNIVLSSGQEAFDGVDCRIGDAELSVLQRIESMIRYDIQAEQRLFFESEHECPVCFDRLPGAEFCRIETCRHYCCRACLLAYIEQSMRDGNVQFLKCPEEKCETALPVPIIRSLLSDEEWRRWETVALNRALDTMGDLAWCPRCRMPVIQEEDHQQSHLARCAYCFFAFCIQCNEAWHQGRKCSSLQEKLEALGNANAVEGDKSEYEKRIILQKKLNILSALKVRETSKPCPGCRIPIEKNFGCNKVICSNCHSSMCYCCGKKIEGYDHFDRGGCLLNDDTSWEAPIMAAQRPPAAPPQAMFQMEVMLEAEPELRRQLTRCPACRQQNLKLNRNNHMRCWACHTTFCYLCHQRVVGGTKTHFGVMANKCPQHSDD